MSAPTTPRTGRALGACVEAVSLQFDYDTWGGDQGEYVFDLVEALNVPAVATLHAIPRKPTPRQRKVLADLAASVDATVVMSQSAATLLKKGYGVDPRRLNVIPHGVPDLPMADTAVIKASLGLEGRRVILSFGLLGPTKGHELMLEALPAVIEANPDVTYVIVGVTHPDLLEADGEAYRATLVARVKALKLGGHVRFVDEFAHRVAMTRWLQAADIVVTPYPDLDQTVSGTLSYAMGAGRAIVSTPVRIRRRTARRGAGRPRPGTLAWPPCGRAQQGARGRSSSEPPSAARPTTIAATWSGRRSARSIARCFSASGPQLRSPDALRR